MSQLNRNSVFYSYELTGDELINSTVLSGLNKLRIQNLISEAASEKVFLTFDPTKPHIFQQREAELQGTIRVLQRLLEESAESEKFLLEQATLASQSQKE